MPAHYIALFERLFDASLSMEECRTMLNSTAKVWTWARLKEKAASRGINAADVVEHFRIQDD
ncbi:MAG: hypothetical protein LBN33_03290 [Desulfovibrio sp.]|nr:hypothetical protein [Desulfovibrio sp.]